MAAEETTDDPADATDRLEAALDRIARAATQGIIRAAGRAEPEPGALPPASDIVARLDGLIARIEAALAEAQE